VTYSVVARDPETGELGVAVQSHWFSVGAVVPHVEPGVGAVATQSVPDPAHGERILARLRAEVALLERARVALLSLRSGQAQLKAAELSALARRFRALSSVQWEEGQSLDAVATQAALSVPATVSAVPAPVEAASPVDPLAAAGEPGRSVNFPKNQES